MSMAKRCWSVFGVLVAVILIAGCSSEQGAAEQALKAAEDLINQVKGEAAKYVPEQFRGLEAGLVSAKETLKKGDYKAALAAATDLSAKAKETAAAAAARKNDLMLSWDGMSGGVPKMVDALKSRIDILSESKKLPANVSQAQFDSAKSGLAKVQEAWAEASEAYKAGNLTDAVEKAKWSRDQAAEIMSSLGMQVPAAAKL